MVVIERPTNSAMHPSRVMPSSTPVSFSSSERIWLAFPSLSTSTPSLSKITRSKRLTGRGRAGSGSPPSEDGRPLLHEGADPLRRVFRLEADVLGHRLHVQRALQIELGVGVARS